MSTPVLERNHDDHEAFYVFVGRVSLQLVKHNVDAITVANFLRELVDAGGSALTVEQAMAMAQNYLPSAPELQSRAAQMRP